MFILIKKIKSIIQGTIIDTYLRLMGSYFSKFYFKNINSKNNSQFEKCLMILYGGLGDCLLLFPMIKNLSKNHNLDIMIEDKFIEIKYILPKNVNCIEYKKNKIFKELAKYRLANEKFVLLQQSPIFEFLIFNFILGKPAVLGFIYNQTILTIEGLNKKYSIKTPINKIKKYELFYDFITRHIKFSKLNKKSSRTLKIDTYKNLKNYFVLAPSKTPTWRGVGILDSKIYLEISNYIYNKSKLIPVLVGSKEDLPMIEGFINNKTKKLRFKNLVGKTNLNDLFKIIQNSKFVISNDNGIHHLSNYLNKKTLTFFTFSSCETFKWNNENSFFIFNKEFECMPCVGNKIGPYDNYPFKCPWNIRCKDTITVNNIIKKIEKTKLI